MQNNLNPVPYHDANKALEITERTEKAAYGGISDSEYDTLNTNTFISMLKGLEGKKIHCITNYVSANFCANALLAVGGSPIMADAPEEVASITAGCHALYLNLGTPHASKMDAMRIAAQTAYNQGIPIVIDPVGCSGSSFRQHFIKALMHETPPTVIKGNLDELTSLIDETYHNVGIDSLPSNREQISLEHRLDISKKVALTFKSTVILTGTVDLITDGAAALSITNGTPEMSRVTGMGCVLGALLALMSTAQMAPHHKLQHLSQCIAFMGWCGETASKAEPKGLGSFAVHFLDAMSPEALTNLIIGDFKINAYA